MIWSGGGANAGLEHFRRRFCILVNAGAKRMCREDVHIPVPVHIWMHYNISFA